MYDHAAPNVISMFNCTNFYLCLFENRDVLKRFCVDFRLSVLSKMSASQELDENQVRQLLFDLDSAYNAFNRLLHNS